MTVRKDDARTAPAKSRSLQLESEPGKDDDATLAELTTRGIVPMAAVLAAFSSDTYSDDTSITHAYKEIERLSTSSASGDLAHLERLLAAQVLALNAVFAGLAFRAKANSEAGFLGAADTYLKLALRAQAQSRLTTQTLFEMKNPRPVAFVQQTNIAGGHQQVNNGDTSHDKHLAHVDMAEAAKSPPSSGRRSSIEQNELLEARDEGNLVTGTKGSTVGASPDLATLG